MRISEARRLNTLVREGLSRFTGLDSVLARLAALWRGNHVLVEKPMPATMARSRELLELAATVPA